MTTYAHRDGFIDALRAIALIRVVVWHATGVAQVSWVITTMPLMFFVAGSLLFASLERRSATIVLKRRLKRLLVPFWFFGALVLSLCAIVHLCSGTSVTKLAGASLWPWVVPLVNPTASAWEAGWASSPLWYLRAYLWILLLSPALVWAWRKVPGLLLTVTMALLIAAQFVANATSAGPGALIWIVGDIGIYTFFVLLGFAHHQGKFDQLSKRELGEWLCVALAATVVAWQFTSSPDGVVNHSYPALLTFGVAWLCAALLVRPALGRAPKIPIVAPALYWMTRRAMSIYLWHSPMIVASYWLLNTVGVAPHPIPVVTSTAVLVVVVSTATGWIEDIAAGRPAQLVPLPEGTTFPQPTAAVRRSRAQLLAGAGIGISMTLIAASIVAQPTAAAALDDTEPRSSLALPPPPSGRPDPNAALPVADVSTTTLEASVDQWREQHGVAGVSIGISSPAMNITFTSGTNGDGSPLDSEAAVAVTSITKTMTAAIALQLVDEGLLRLDDPIPTMTEVPELANAGPITLRQLLNHSSGLVPYQQAPGYDPGAALTPVQAVRLAASTPLEWQPGSAAGYSNSGFLLVGLLIEQVTGEPFADVIERRVFAPNAMSSSSLDDTPTRGWVGDAAGGAVANVDDLVRWGNALYRSKNVMAPDSHTEMTSIDAELMAGLGTFPVCPCIPASESSMPLTSVTPASIGHNGGSVTMQYAQTDDILIVASFTESFWTSDFDQQAVYQLLDELRSAAR